MTPALPGDDCSRFLDAVLLSSKLQGRVRYDAAFPPGLTPSFPSPP